MYKNCQINKISIMRFYDSICEMSQQGSQRGKSPQTCTQNSEKWAIFEVSPLEKSLSPTGFILHTHCNEDNHNYSLKYIMGDHIVIYTEWPK